MIDQQPTEAATKIQLGREVLSQRKGSPKDILVAGDLMIDRTWIVHPYNSESIQSHGGIDALKLIDRKANNGALGGAGSIVRRLIARGARVRLAGAWSKVLQFALSNNHRKFIPEIPAKSDLFHGIQTCVTEFDTERHRIYEGDRDSQVFKLSFFNDLTAADHAEPNLNEWPAENEISAVIYGDYARGLLELEKFVTKVKDYKKKPFIVRPKSEPALKLPWTILAPNRADFSRFLMKKNEPLPRRVFAGTKQVEAIHPSVLNAMQKLARKYKGAGRSILLKLDKEGALLLDEEGNLHAYHINEEYQGRYAGIGAGDVLLADLAFYLVHQNKSLPEAVKSVVTAATWYCKSAENVYCLADGSPWYGRDSKVHPELLHESNSREESETKTVTHRQLGSALKFAAASKSFYDLGKGNIIEWSGKISVGLGHFYLPGYLTTDVKLGTEIQSLADELERFSRPDRRESGTFVVAICGPPGSGKTRLAKALTAAIGAAGPTEASVAQFNTIADLHRWFEMIRTGQIKDNRTTAAFLDEVDSLLEGQFLYAKLLDPILEGHYSFEGVQRHLGRVIFFLAGSTKAWKNDKSLMAAARKEKYPKLGDLVSRLSRAPITIPGKSPEVDRLLLAVFHLKKCFPKAKRVERRLLWLLLRATPVFRARSVEKGIRALPLVEKNDVITLDVAKMERARSALEMHFSGLFNGMRKFEKLSTESIELGDW